MSITTITDQLRERAREAAETIVDIVRTLRELGPGKHRPTIRSCIAIARVVVHQGFRVSGDDPAFIAVCQDILNNLETARVTRAGEQITSSQALEVIQKVCTSRGAGKRSR